MKQLTETKYLALLGLAAIVLIGGTATWMSRSSSPPAAEAAPQQPRAQEHSEEGHNPSDQSEHGEASESHAEGAHAEERHSGAVHLDQNQAQTLGIKIQEVDTGSASARLSRPAAVYFDKDRIARVGPRVEAKVVRVIKDLGDRVQEDEPVALMSSVELGKAKADYLTAAARLETQEAEYTREKSLYEQEISSEAEFLTAKAKYQEAKANLRAAREALKLYGLSTDEIDRIESESDKPLSQFYLTSPVPGIVQKRDLSPGTSVSPSETPIHVADPRQMWVMIDAYERDVPVLAKGQRMNLQVRSLPEQRFEGVVDWVSFELDEESRTIKVRALVENPDGLLRAGMFGTAHVSTEQNVSYPMVPVDAVQTIGERKVVFVPGAEEGSYKPVEVRLGAESAGRVEVVSGLQEGRRAVVGGAFELKSALTAGSRSAAHSH